VNEKLEAKVDSSLDSYESLLKKIKILCIHSNELTSKLENINSTPYALEIETPKFNKKDASTSCLDLIDINSNPCKKVLLKNVIVETCSK
jgi:hypothetical protein